MRKTYRIPVVPRGGIGNEVARGPVKATSLLKAILLVAGLALVTATPSLAQSYDPDVGSGNIVPSYGQTAQWGVAQGALNAYARNHGRAARQGTPYDAYAQTPDLRSGYRWPGAHYDAEGRFIDENSPGRW
jgi:hypothetical protein